MLSHLLSGPLAGVDIGSNSLRLEIGQLQNGRYRRIDYLKETVRLGAGLDAEGKLGEAAAQRGLDCLGRFAQRLAGFDTRQVRAVATQTLREARNRNDFLLRAQDALGYPIDIISGREEARLIYAGVANLQPSPRARLVVDIGGRSTEMVLGRGRSAQTAESFQLGSVSLSMRFFGDGKLSGESFRAAQIAAGAELEEAMLAFAPRRWQEALGASGTVGAVSQLLAANGLSDGRITPDGLRWCIAACVQCGHVDRLSWPALRAERRAVLPGGLAILYTLATHFGIHSLLPARGALRHGVIIDLHERLEALRHNQPEDVRDASVRELQRRFGVGPGQAQRVRLVALGLYEHVAAQADTENRRELGWACDLHEIGQMISHHDHHRHSAYLVANADTPGFSQSQQRRISELVLGQRGGLRKLESRLSNDEAFAWQTLCLRLAVIACHARGAVEARAMRLSRDANTALLGFAAHWAKNNPRTLHLLREEAETWSRLGTLRLQLPR